ncbi:MAG TPA: MgtC/SapB family protein [Trebonia sp.]|jgi:putative Mg2+ transporter-C (MgtC) family protein|nr:MgtC/SapB family protein [Trebonia sp.]
MNVAFAQAAMLPAARASSGQGWHQAGELGAALLLSAVIGAEREVRHKDAGLRTHALVGVGSGLFMLISKYGFADVLQSQLVVLDPSRVAAQIVSGVGFLGAGLIFVRRDGVRGLTTAAGIWVTAAVGAAAGAGLLLLAVLTTGAYMVVTLILPAVQRFLLPVTVHRASTLYVRYPDGHGLLQAVADEATKRGYRIDSLSADPAADQMVAAGPRDDGRQAMAAVTLRVRGSRPVRELTAALNDLERVDAVITGDYPAMDE